MAKVTGPLMSMSALGKFAGSMVFSIWKGRPYVRQLVTPANPQTAGQETSRNMVRVGGAVQKQINASLQVSAGLTQRDELAIRAVTPAGYAWNGYLVESMVGAGQLNYAAAGAAYAALSAPQKTDWNNAAIALTPAYAATFQTSAGGVSAPAVTAGEAFFRHRYAMSVMGIVAVPGAVPPVYA